MNCYNSVKICPDKILQTFWPTWFFQLHLLLLIMMHWLLVSGRRLENLLADRRGCCHNTPKQNRLHHGQKCFKQRHLAAVTNMGIPASATLTTSDHMCYAWLVYSSVRNTNSSPFSLHVSPSSTNVHEFFPWWSVKFCSVQISQSIQHPNLNSCILSEASLRHQERSSFVVCCMWFSLCMSVSGATLLTVASVLLLTNAELQEKTSL